MPDPDPPTDGETRAVTYTELARIRGIGRESAVKLVQRRQWRRVPGNASGEVRILVPLEWLAPASPDDPPQPSGEPGPDAGAILAAVEAAAEGWREALRMANAEARRLNEALTAEQGRAARAEARAQQAENQATAARQEADQAREAAQGAENRLAALQQADQARREAPAWARAWRALRGR